MPVEEGLSWNGEERLVEIDVRPAIPDEAQPCVPELPPHFNLDVKRLNRRRRAGSFAAGILVLFVLLFSSPPVGHALLRYSLGGLAMLTGIALRVWALCCIEGNKKRRLVTWGAYSHLRHPLYFGSLLLIAGFATLAGSLGGGVLACLAFVLLYLPAIVAEERFLAVRFPQEWEAYCRQVKTFIPRFGGPLAERAPLLSLRRPLQEIGALVVVSLAALGALASVQALRRIHELPDWFW